MKRIEELLADERERITAIQAPEELEGRLRQALDRTPDRRRRSKASRWAIAVAIAAIVISVGGYNYEAFAYYGQRILGFDAVMTGTLKKVNAAGMGQTVDQHVVLQDGTELVVSGLMADANQLILYYSLRNPDGIAKHTQDSFRLSQLTGFLTDSYMGWGTTTINDEQTELIGLASFDPVNGFAKQLTLHYAEQTDDQHTRMGSLTFPYHPKQAIQTQVQQAIKTRIAVDQGAITFGSITATPLSTVVKGTWNVKELDRVRQPFEGIELLANGKPVSMEGSGVSNSVRGRTFELRYDTLPKDLETLQLVVRTFSGYERTDAEVNLTHGSQTDVQADRPISVGSKELWIKQVKTTDEGTEITLATEDDVLLNGVTLETMEGMTELRTTIGQTEAKGKDGEVLKERTLLFDTSGQSKTLHIEGIHYRKTYDKTVDIPLD
ncbi:DUF4179 domain-containing protein [Paenibacillus massiliensis]|uniref:DUF4179 domain-containing protein n=1 Tax=Paenibacillus massiliensis TaxID=225917 RepID=UPI000381DA7F|nr:DUF4179 domain-containing protein [Paenibacillus massiliensis]